MFNDLKKVIGEFHFTPTEAYESYFGENTLNNGTIISIALPYSDEIREINKQSKDPSKKWTEVAGFMGELSNYIKEILEDEGYNVIDPTSQEFFEITKSENIYSNWSQKHVAYVSGLGTFSLNSGLITDKGRAVLLISLITDLEVELDSRPYESHNANCLFFHDGSCKECIDRCPAGAISEDGIDKSKCLDMSLSVESKDFEMNASEIDNVYGCGLCQIEIPCESENPVKVKNR